MTLKYGLVRTANIYNTQSHEGAEVIATTGDYLKAQFWSDENLNDLDTEIRDILQTFVWAYIAARRNGEAERLGLPDKMTKDALFDMADNVTVFMDGIEDGSLPLAEKRSR